ncbi:MAG: 2-oxoacid:acceptor oxidoreductase family protein [Thermodesulfobacteriota bacterium]|nr:2-oxoacid:acceptor oxidoreductase family protein [Thermodesulfobacteriota bacterium]
MKKTVFAGFGGQGVLMMGYVFAVAAMRNNKEVTYLPAYGAEVRGGTANCTVVVSDDEIFSPVASSPDFAVIMNKPSLLKYEGIMREGGVILLNSNHVSRELTRDDLTAIGIPAVDIAGKLGSERIVNMVMLGAFAAQSNITSLDSIMNGLSEIVKNKKTGTMNLNRKGLDAGAEYILKGDLQ